ncbi:transposase [Saccharothrix sp. ALI-22-I]|uniref:transposase n=1 Tax=Saccharothrix sp. ALI-22-I TaxID=1933778 RepID=UPI0019311390|nr:transposase [Saccharothrix sp. ALI-22-I]
MRRCPGGRRKTSRPAERACSPYDTDARYATKRGSGWEGYTIHLTETCDDIADTGSPHPVTNVVTTDATVTDVEVLERIHTDLDRRGLVPDEHVVDAGYTSADLMVGARREHGITLLGPLRVDNSAQPRTGDGYGRAAFAIDWDRRRVVCPQGVRSTIRSECSERGRDSVVVAFPVTACQSCPVRPQCTRSTRSGRQLMLRTREVHEAVERARTEQATDEWKQRYATRAGVEGTVHQAVAVTGVRRSRYTGLPKTRLAHVFTATALNLIRLDAWWSGTSPGTAELQPPRQTRPRRIAELGNRVPQGVERRSGTAVVAPRLTIMPLQHMVRDHRSSELRCADFWNPTGPRRATTHPPVHGHQAAPNAGPRQSR